MTSKNTATDRLDSIIEDDVARGFRIREVPDAVRKSLTDHGFEPPTYVKFLALNASRRRDINEAVQLRYHEDLRNPKILSEAEIRKLVEARGQWTAIEEARMVELGERTQRDMVGLYQDGYSEEGTAWRKEMLEADMQIREGVKELEEHAETFVQTYERWARFTPDQQAVYTDRYAEEQGLEQYRADRDLNTLLSLATPTLATHIETIDDLKDKQQRVEKLAIDLQELQALRFKHARIFSGSAEARQSSSEEMAQIYFACVACTEDGKEQGKLTPTFDEFFSWPHAAHKWFLYEAYFFHNDIPVVAATDYLKSFGFLPADRVSSSTRGESVPSDASLAPLDSNTASEPATTTP